MSDKLSALDTIHVTAVLEDCVDQLAILGSILPVSADNQRGHQVRNLLYFFIFAWIFTFEVTNRILALYIKTEWN